MCVCVCFGSAILVARSPIKAEARRPCQLGSKVASAARGYFVVKAYEHLKVSVLDVATATLLLADFMLDIDVVLTKIEACL